MIDQQSLDTLAGLNLRIERVLMIVSSSEVCVGLMDPAGNRFLGRATRDPQHPERALQEAFELALCDFEPRWRECELASEAKAEPMPA